MWHAVEELFDVQIEDPVSLPAAFPASCHRIQRRPLRPVAIGIRMENGLHPGLQMHGHHRLSDAIGDGRNTEQTNPIAMRLRDFHTQHRRREVTPRGHPVPDSVQIVLQILFEVLDGAGIHSRCTLIGPNLLPRLPHTPLRNLKRLARQLQLVHATPPGEHPVDRTNTATDNPAPSLRPHYRDFLATTSRSAGVPRDGTQRLTVSTAWRAPSCAAAPSAPTRCRGDTFPGSMQKPQIRLAPPPCRTPPGQ